MLVCPNTNSKEWKSLVNKIGIVDAYRQYILANGEIPDASLFEETFKGVNATTKIVGALSSPKAEELFKRFYNSNPDKFYGELVQMAGKDQVDMLRDWANANPVTSVMDMITGVLAETGFVIEIATAKTNKPVKERIYTIDDYNYIGRDENGGIYLVEQAPYGDNLQYITEEEAKRIMGEENYNKLAITKIPLNTSYYSNLTVPGGTNYTENEIATPAITPAIKGHAQFATNQGIGWFRSDDKLDSAEIFIKPNTRKKQLLIETWGDSSKYKEILSHDIDVYYEKLTGDLDAGGGVLHDKTTDTFYYLHPDDMEPLLDRPTTINSILKQQRGGVLTKIRRILELQSDLFQKGRKKEYIVSEQSSDELNRKIGIKALPDFKANAFLQLLNKDNNWVTFFIKSIIQDSAKKGYEKVLFPSGNTISKIEGHETLEEFKKQKEDRIKVLKDVISENKKLKEKESESLYDEMFPSMEIEDAQKEISQLKQELERVEKEGFAALRPIYNFYENTVANVLRKQYGKDNVKQITDEYGNTWNEVTVGESFKEDTIYFSRVKFPSEEEQRGEIGQRIALTMANRLMGNFNIPFNIITKDEARDINEKWNGEGAFYYKGKTFFVEDGFTMDNVLHEYGHPLIDAIYTMNRTLFDKLYTDLTNTQEGIAIKEAVEKEYPEYEVGSEYFKKEVIVIGLTRNAMNKKNGIKNSKSFSEFIDRLVFAVKQVLRKAFKMSIKVEKLTPETTLEQLAKMLKTDEFEINTDIISQSDFIVQYNKIREEQESLENVSDEKINSALQRFYNVVVSQLRTLSKSKGFENVKKALITEIENKGLVGIKLTLEQTAQINKKLAAYLDEIEAQKKNVDNFIHSINQLEQVLQNVQTDVNELSKLGDTKEALTQVFYYDGVIKYWDKFIEDTLEELTDSGMDPSSVFGNKMSAIQSRIKQIKRKINAIYTPGVADILFDALLPLKNSIDAEYAERINQLKKKNAPAKKIKETEKEYEKFRLDRDKVEKMIKGELGDTNYFSAYAESLANSPDPVVGGFAVFLKNNYSVAQNEWLKESNNFTSEITKLLEKAGYSNTNFVKLMEKLVFIETRKRVNSKTGEMEEVEQWHFLNPFKNVNTVLDDFNIKIDKAKEAGDEKLEKELIRQMRKHLRDYFHQEYTPAYYEREEIYETFDKYDDLKKLTFDIMGINPATATAEQMNDARKFYTEAADEAYKQKYLVLNAIKDQNVLNYDPLHFEESAIAKKILWRKYSQLASNVDLNGNPKQGMEKLSAAIEKKYRVVSRDLFEWVPIEGQFELSLRTFEKELSDQNLSPEEYNAKRQKWIDENTVVSFKKEFYDERNKILMRLKELYAMIPSEDVRKSVDSSEEFLEILGYATGFRDQDGQIIGTDISEKSKKKIMEVQESINKKKAALAGYSGLTKEEMDEMLMLYNMTSYGGLTDEEQSRLNALASKKNSLGVNKAIRTEISKKFAELMVLQSREATDYYVDIMNNFLTTMGKPLIDNTSADELLNYQRANILMNENADFKKWFLENHLVKEVFDPQTKTEILKYERSFVWNRVRPNNPDHYETITLSDGEKVNKPNLTYFKRSVKEKTKREVGKTVNNIGEFLPKTIAEGGKDDGGGTNMYQNENYYELKRTDKAAFDVLEKAFEQHLKYQEWAPRNSRLWTAVPRFRNQASERVLALRGEVSRAKQWLLDFKANFMRSNDDYDTSAANFDPNALVMADSLIDEESRKIPVQGLANIKKEEVSMNLLNSINRYGYSVIHQRKLIELNPIARALQSVVRDPKNVKAINKFKKWMKKTLANFAPSIRSDASIRQTAISNLIEREFEGVMNSDYLANVPEFQKVRTGLARMVSLGFFGGINMSMFKNKLAAQEQHLIEAAGGRWLNLHSLTLGKLRAWKSMGMISANVWTSKNRPLDYQMLQIFEPLPGFFEETVRGQFGRSMFQDIVSLDALTAPRKWLASKATLDLFWGMMYHQNAVEQTINGVTNKITYADAWEIKDNTLQLKPGIDPEWGVGGKKFNEIKNRVNEVRNRTEGTYNAYDQPMMMRISYFQWAGFLKKFFMSMAANYAARKRPSAALGALSQGTYAAFFNVAREAFTYRAQNFMWLDVHERAALRKVGMQFSSMALISALLYFNFGWDDDDEALSLKLMRERQGGPLGSEDFELSGWLANQYLIVLLGTRLETSTWYNPNIAGKTLIDLPQPGALWDAGLKLPLTIGNQMYDAALGKEKGYYQKEVGPYSWQQKDEAKVKNTISEIFGFTGVLIDPSVAAKKIQATARGIY